MASFLLRLMFFREHTLATFENAIYLERPYSGVNFELQLLSQVLSEIQIGEVNVPFVGDVKQK